MTPTKQPIDFLIYLILFGSTIFVNKYVLSVLNFTYPTIYQGWQTLVGGILLRVLLSNKCLSVSATDLDKPGFISLLPSFLFFAAGIVASSKALGNLSVPVFLCLQNTLGAMLYLMEIAPSFRGGSGPFPLLASLITIGTAVAAVLADIDMTVDALKFSDSPYFWMLVYLACVAVQTLHSKIADARYTDVDRLYFSYVFSVVVLAPASLYLEEAFEVLHFPHAMRYDFYAGCLLSGVLGLFLNLSYMKVRRHNYFSIVDASGRLLTSLLALATFADVTTVTVKILVCINLVSAVFVPLPTLKDAEGMDEVNEPLKEGV
ncbi:UDP-N-acetylglucosamine transporter TMEM241-like isoform X1 [Procambarus clarkii]|uniref:UDP-N-acetylglucosamine transporter TMEM241 isoform X1 n=1 Tax=Procambarus clarkii TaxID=6728 RepID=UPI001E670E79|nr:transmembrane protein 241-like isoform X1 [Procambarus clarkii]XP_045614803.1 transmembrane protein 241-like isoform X1 [Procambarus clarkii]